MLIRLIQMHSKIHSKLPSWQVKSKPERGLGSAPGRFRLAAPCFARISQRHLITHRSCHVHKVAAAVRRSVEIRTLFLCPPPCLLPSTNSVRSLPPALASTTHGAAVSFILLTCAIAPGCNCERATDRQNPPSLSILYVLRSVPSISPETIIAFYFGARSGRCEGSMCRNLT